MDNEQNNKKENIVPLKESAQEEMPQSKVDIDENTVFDGEPEVKEEKKVKKSFLDFNFSLIMIFVACAIILGFGTLQLQHYTGKLQPTVYIIIVVIVSILVNFLAYTGFKLLGGLIGGYQMTRLQIFGFTIIFTGKGKKNIVRFNIKKMDEFHYTMTPKKEKPNHYLYFLSGMIGYLILSGIVLGVSFIFPKDSVMQITFLFSISYGFIIPLYELFPCRLDYPNDCFLLIKTRKKEDLEAYHLELRNIRHILLDEDIETKEFENYDTYHKSHIIYYNYLDNLYKDKLDEAVECLTNQQKYKVYYTDDLKTKVWSEKIFLLLFSEDYEGAEQLYGSLNREFKHRFADNMVISQFRSSIMIAALINNSLEETTEVLKDYKDYCDLMKDYSSARKDKEIELFNIALEKVKTARPDWDLDAELNKTIKTNTDDGLED